jgi:hypothetical protein
LLEPLCNCFKVAWFLLPFAYVRVLTWFPAVGPPTGTALNPGSV